MALSTSQDTGLVQSANYTITPGPVTAAQSAVTASPTTGVTANATAFSTVTVTLRYVAADAQGIAITNANAVWSVSGVGNAPGRQLHRQQDRNRKGDRHH